MCSWWCTVVASYQDEHVELWAQTEDRTRVGSSPMKVVCGFSESEEFCPLEKQIRQKAELLFNERLQLDA